MDIGMIWIVGVLLVSGGLFLIGLSCFVYVTFLFLSALLKETKISVSKTQEHIASSPLQPSKLKEFIRARMSPTEGDYVAYSDEEAFINEQVQHLRQQGLTEEELQAFIRQAVTDKEEK